MIAFYTIMLQPGLILIDSGHFQWVRAMELLQQSARKL